MGATDNNPTQLGQLRITLTPRSKVRTIYCMLRIAIDIGGTFTDVVAQTSEGFTSAKVLTQPTQPEVGAMDGVQRLLKKLSKNVADISDVVHGTTLATNALIERRGAKTAFVTTAGFRDVLEMRYEKRFDQYALDIEFPEPIVPRLLRFGLDERILADGSVLKAPSIDDINNIAHALKQQNVEAVAIGFLHSYKNLSHEKLVAQRLSDLLDKQVTICLSAEVAGEIREYERFSTVCANAYVRPLMSRYLDKLLGQLNEQGFKGSFLMMLSDGALTTLENALRFPIRLVEGGPAGGVALAAQVATEIGSAKTLSLDVGGTTAKICFIENGTPKTARRFEIGRAWKGLKGSGLPVRVPTVELVEIGAGGGSIATVDALQRLRVGPQSASAVPGPAAYAQGGTDATLTDAHITLGNLDPEGFANGMIQLQPLLARNAVAEHIQAPLAFDTAESAASGIVELANETLANAARVHGIELGLDIASFDLLVSGGGGGLHGARIAEKLGIKRVLVPRNAGVGSAVGFLHSPVAFKSALSVLEPLSEIDSDQLAQRLTELENSVRSVVADAVPSEWIEVRVNAELRYQGQGLELSFELSPDAGFSEALVHLENKFRNRYQEIYGFVLENIAVELVALSVNAKDTRTPTSSPTFIPNTVRLCPKNTRSIHNVQTGDSGEYRVVPRDAVGCQVMVGPIVIPEAQTTTLVPSGWSVVGSTHGHLIMSRTNA